MKYYKSIILAFLLMCVISPSVLAETNGTSSKADFEKRRMEVQNHLRQLKEGRNVDGRMGSSSTSTKMMVRQRIASSTRSVEKCELLAERIEKRRAEFEARFTRGFKVFENHSAKLKELSAKAGKAGLDVSKLNSDIAILDVKIAKLNEDKELMRGGLSTAKEFTCGDSEGDFKEAVSILPEAARVVGQDVKEIREFIQTTIKADMKDLQEDYRELKGDKKTATSTSSTN